MRKRSRQTGRKQSARSSLMATFCCDFAIGALGEVDGAHAAAAEQRRARGRRRRRRPAAGSRLVRTDAATLWMAFSKYCFRAGYVLEQRFDLASDARVRGTPRSRNAARRSGGMAAARSSSLSTSRFTLRFPGAARPGPCGVRGDGMNGRARALGDFIGGHAGEEAHFDERGFASSSTASSLSASSSAITMRSRSGAKSRPGCKGDFQTVAALAGFAGAGVVHQDLAHDARGDAEEVGAIFVSGGAVSGRGEGRPR